MLVSVSSCVGAQELSFGATLTPASTSPPGSPPGWKASATSPPGAPPGWQGTEVVYPTATEAAWDFARIDQPGQDREQIKSVILLVLIIVAFVSLSAWGWLKWGRDPYGSTWRPSQPPSGSMFVPAHRKEDLASAVSAGDTVESPPPLRRAQYVSPLEEPASESPAGESSAETTAPRDSWGHSTLDSVSHSEGCAVSREPGSDKQEPDTQAPKPGESGRGTSSHRPRVIGLGRAPEPPPSASWSVSYADPQGTSRGESWGSHSPPAVPRVTSSSDSIGHSVARPPASPEPGEQEPESADDTGGSKLEPEPKPDKQDLPLDQVRKDLKIDPLTERETEVLRLVADGLSYQQIANRLSIVERTVKFHMQSVFDKLGLRRNRRRAMAVRRARELDLLS